MGLFSGISKLASGITGGNLLSAGASIFSGIMGAESAADTNAASLNAQKELRDTQYQSAVNDMQKAGLNPMLATKLGGNLASSVPQLTPPASAGIQSALNSAQVAKTYADAKAAEATANNQQANADVTSQLGALKVQSEIDNLRTNAQSNLSQDSVNQMITQRIGYEIPKLISENDLTFNQAHLVRHEIENAILSGKEITARTGNIKVDTALKQAQRILVDTESEVNRQQINFNVLDIPRRKSESDMWSTPFGKTVPYMTLGGSGVSNAANAAANLKFLIK